MDVNTQAPAVVVSSAELGQLAYHVRCAAALAASTRIEDAAPHAILAGALFDELGGDHLRFATGVLDLPELTADAGSAPAAAHHRDAAQQLAIQLVAHFTSEGRHDLASLYQAAADRIPTP